ncbi:MAG: uroporphyrinogen-III C-methyltransferase [Dehalococcoidales bacterium]
MFKTGKVYLVGAGPGDPGLITQKGIWCLNKAEVVVYDNLLDKHLLEQSPAGVEKIYVGKRAGKHAKTQSEINCLLVDKAREGKAVVRLKGGDPFVLGRGGEEAETLAEEGISYEVVPGITSAVAVPAYAGIPVTHRSRASSFAVITGHEDPAKETSSIAWEKLATGVDTLVFLMGMHNLPGIVAKLTEHGRPADTPVAVIKDGTSHRQITVVGTLANIAALVEERQISAPAVIVVGEVVNLREKLAWFDNRPLFNKRVLVTRSRHQASALSKLLSERGAQPIELPAIDVQPINDNTELDRAIDAMDSYQWVLFTSVNGVEAFFERLNNLKFDSRALGGKIVGAIGSATASALETKGIIPDFVPDTFTSEGIIAGLKSRNINGQRFLLPRADIADKELTSGLAKLGAEVKEVAVYRTVPATESIAEARQRLLAGEIDVITFTSSSTVTNLLAALPEGLPKINNYKVACIGPKTAATAAGAGLKTDIIAGEQTIPGLVAAIETYFGKEV